MQLNLKMDGLCNREFAAYHMNSGMEKSKVFLIRLNFLDAGCLVFAGWVNDWLSPNGLNAVVKTFNRCAVHENRPYFLAEGLNFDKKGSKIDSKSAKGLAMTCK